MDSREQESGDEKNSPAGAKFGSSVSSFVGEVFIVGVAHAGCFSPDR